MGKLAGIGVSGETSQTAVGVKVGVAVGVKVGVKVGSKVGVLVEVADGDGVCVWVGIGVGKNERGDKRQNICEVATSVSIK